MKKYFLFLAWALCAALAFCSPAKNRGGFKSPFESLELYCSAAATLPQNAEGDLWADSAYVFSYGAKLRFTGIEARYFNSCNKTLGEDLYKIDGDSYYDVFEKRRYSLALDLKKFCEHIDSKIFFGSISVHSWMTNPVFSTNFSPFAYSLGDAQTMWPSLPTKSSSKKDDAFFAQGNLHFVENLSNETFRFLPIRFEFFCAKNEVDEEKTPFICGLSGGFLYKNFLKVTNGFKFARYYCSQNSAAGVYWCEEIPVWRSSLYNSFMNETTVAIPHLKNKIIFGITENSESLGRFWLRDELLFKAGGFAVAAGAFLSDNIFLQEEVPLITMGASKKYQLWQIKLVPEFCVPLKKGESLKFGAGGFLESKITNYEKENQFDSLDAKFSAGVKYSGKAQSFKFTGAVSNIEIRQHLKENEEMHLPKISAQTTYSHKFKNKRRFSISTSAFVQPKKDSSQNEYGEKLSASYYPGLGVLKNVSLGVSASQKNSENKISPYAKASFLFNLKKVKINADIAVNSNFKIEE